MPTPSNGSSEHGGLKRENGDHFRETLLSRGGSDEAMKLFRNFTGARAVHRAASEAPRSGGVAGPGSAASIRAH